MIENSLISVIVPVYNGEKYLSEAIYSILNQTYQNLEVLLIDDGSSDSSGVICDQLAKEDQRVRVIHKQNSGVSETRNIGISEAKGDCIGFVDCDDICEKDMFNKLYKALTTTNSDLSIGMFSDLIGNDKILHHEPIRPGIYIEEEIKDKIIMPMVGSPTSAPQCAPVMGTLCRCLFKTELIKTPTLITMKKIKMAEDLLFDLEYLCRCKQVVVIGDSVYNYRQNISSSVHNYIASLYQNITTQLLLMKNVLIENNMFDDKMREYFGNTVAYDLAWCMTNECKKTNPSSKKIILKTMCSIRKSPEFRDCISWKFIRHIKTKEKYYFMMIKLGMYRAIIMFNRRILKK